MVTIFYKKKKHLIRSRLILRITLYIFDDFSNKWKKLSLKTTVIGIQVYKLLYYQLNLFTILL